MLSKWEEKRKKRRFISKLRIEINHWLLQKSLTKYLTWTKNKERKKEKNDRKKASWSMQLKLAILSFLGEIKRNSRMIQKRRNEEV